jgi:hypothetical protein
MTAESIDSLPTRLDPSAVVSGTVHIYVAFDWGDEVDLEAARRLLTGELQALARRRRTPSSFGYSPPPLRYPLAPIELTLHEPDPSPRPAGGEPNHSHDPAPESQQPQFCATFTATADATLFDFGGVSVAMHVPVSMTAADLTRLAVCRTGEARGATALRATSSSDSASGL